MLPSVNGFEVCRRLRDNAETRDIRILMLTARGKESEAAKGKITGADAYMSKPFATKELVKIVTSLVESTEQ
jgi:DNA-binding response OmpR family regulator